MATGTVPSLPTVLRPLMRLHRPDARKLRISGNGAWGMARVKFNAGDAYQDFPEGTQAYRRWLESLPTGGKLGLNMFFLDPADDEPPSFVSLPDPSRIACRHVLEGCGEADLARLTEGDGTEVTIMAVGMGPDPASNMLIPAKYHDRVSEPAKEALDEACSRIAAGQLPLFAGADSPNWTFWFRLSALTFHDLAELAKASPIDRPAGGVSAPTRTDREDPC